MRGRDKVRNYLCRQLRHNCRPSTIRSSATTILLFLSFLSKAVARGSRRSVQSIPAHLLMRLKRLYAFLNFWVEHDVISADVIKRKLRIRVPDALPRAIDPEDIKQLLAIIKKPRDQALILTLIRTGMRIGAFLSTRVEDLNLIGATDSVL